MSERKPRGSHQSNRPFESLGRRLRYLREQGNETVADASGAVEIDVETLDRIEAGFERPSEDILSLLLEHYGIQDQEADKLWNLAGYDPDDDSDSTRPALEDMLHGAQKQMIMLLAMDLRTIYSDGVDIGITQAGLTLTFTQSTGDNKRSPVSRLGMSYDQAQAVVDTMQSALLRAKYLKNPTGLPAPRDHNDPSASE